MGKYFVIITVNYHITKSIRFRNNNDAEKAYQKYKGLGYNVIKAKLEKAYELNVINV